jgi:hypothetical protein
MQQIAGQNRVILKQYQSVTMNLSIN